MLVTKVTRWSGARIGVGWGEGGIELSFLGPAEGRGQVGEVKDELALFTSVFLVVVEGDKGANVAAVVVGATADKALGCVERNSTGGGVVLAGVVRVDGSDRFVGVGDQRGVGNE
ncbi:hypothetical protein AYL99_12074 [Fonsecaea erecta]|uniref:Uncharacterized protein n=1 Tax=Fonsecaea erecta TaxID=1367422 RepID=A0A178Z2U5_9EURO|nr:hypothetical protein AYL99_12074 [Fonsecaea erecta]OAP53736.1 hypothetical protein AYL99_12074 [Fonsecaea erecta]